MRVLLLLWTVGRLPGGLCAAYRAAHTRGYFVLQFVHFVLCSVLCSFPLPARARLQRSQLGFCAVQPALTQSFILVWEGKSFRALWFYSAAEKFTMGSVASCSGKRPPTFMTTSQPVSRCTRLQNYNNNHVKL